MQGQIYIETILSIWYYLPNRAKYKNGSLHCMTRRRFALEHIPQTEMKNLLKKQAILDIVITPESESWLRLVSYSYNKEKQCDIFKIDNGGGDHLYALFSKEGAILKCFDHESCLSPYLNHNVSVAPVFYAQVPDALQSLLELEIEQENVTSCLWQLSGETTWHHASTKLPDLRRQKDAQQLDDGGEASLLGYIFADAKDWYEWAAVYYELTEEAWDAVELLYETGELTRSMVVDLNAERDYDTIIDECTVNGLL